MLKTEDLTVLNVVYNVTDFMDQEKNVLWLWHAKAFSIICVIIVYYRIATIIMKFYIDNLPVSLDPMDLITT